ncbi:MULTISPECIES: metallophosphoesterase family protein [unclassified Cytobacillus]|uniref:metallophosphoesterase family protein n=1 Tax=unclassified Cytobacillus TaxID=2675268 RepID=UPI0013591DD4|nr:metallophosphoesterase family protein [Cytobacillus sp. AMY 15.2]MCM3091097.1 metallophosphatase family protein [Cytobacillus sp. AMY 15.2]
MIKKILILSDTHMPKKSKKLPEVLLKAINGCDLIIHAGDWQTSELYHELKKYAPVEGVYGNTDNDEMHTILKEKILLEINGFKIGVVHGHGKGKTTEKRSIEAFGDGKVDAIIFGHSHIPVNKLHNGVILFNPGSPTDKRRQPNYSFGTLEIADELIFNHVFFDSKE